MVREPLIEYLRSSADLIKQLAWAFPAFGKDAAGRRRRVSDADSTADEMDALLDHAFERYFETQRPVRHARALPADGRRLKAIGVDEIACLIDFGVDADAVLGAASPQLDELRAAVANAPAEAASDALDRRADRAGTA